MNKKTKKRICLVCGYKIPLANHMSITFLHGAECPKCHSYMLSTKRDLFFQYAVFILLFPSAYVFESNNLVGGVLVLLVITLSLWLRYNATYRIDPSHAHREQK